jgi:Helix-turn-helix domain
MGLSRDMGASEMAGISRGIEQVAVRLLPDGRLSAADAARYLGHADKTLAAWRLRGIGPAWRKVGGRIFYFRRDLDRFIAGEGAAQVGADDERS